MAIVRVGTVLSGVPIEDVPDEGDAVLLAGNVVGPDAPASP